MNAYVKWRGWADEKVCCDYGLRVVVPVNGDKIDDATKADMEELTSEQFGVNTFKMSLVGDGRLSNDDALLDALEHCKKIGGLMQLHAESGDLVARGEKNMAAKGITGPEGFAMAHSETAEEEAVMRATTLANQLNCPLYLGPITSSSAAEVMKRKKSRGAVVFAETTAAALGCDGSAYWNQCWRHAAGFVCEPPLRNGQKDAILNGLVGDNDGVSFDTLASDSCTFNSKQKAIGKQDFAKIPAGVNGVEERMSVLWELAVHSGRMTPSQFVAATSSNAARLFNMYPTKGRIEVGADADVVIWNPRASKTVSAKTHQLKVDFNVFEMLECHGVAETVICQGRVVIDDGQMRVAGGFGKFLPLRPFAPHIFNKIKEKEESEAALAPRSVARTESDMTITNGSSCEIPPPTPPKSSQAERAPSQHVSNFDLRSHPNSSDFEMPSSRNSPLRSSVRVRAPPGGKSVGSFW
jgi:dihydropyrimidinase